MLKNQTSFHLTLLRQQLLVSVGVGISDKTVIQMVHEEKFLTEPLARFDMSDEIVKNQNGQEE